MDVHNKPITECTFLCDITIENSCIMNFISIENIDSNALNSAILLLNLSDSDIHGEKKLRLLHHVINCNEVKVSDVITLVKSNVRKMFRTMFLQYLVQTASLKQDYSKGFSSDKNLNQLLRNLSLNGNKSSSPRNNNVQDLNQPDYQVTECLQQITTTLTQLSNKIENTSYGNSAPAQSTYAKTPKDAPPIFDRFKNSISFKRFYDKKFKRWLCENKLSPNDWKIHLHKVFSNNVDRDRAWAIVSKDQNSTIDDIIREFQVFFQLNDTELFDLKQQFYSFKIRGNFQTAFSQLFELALSISGSNVDEATNIETCKIQFQRSLRPVSGTTAQLLKAFTLSTGWKEASTINTVCKLIRQVTGTEIQEINNKLSDISVSHKVTPSKANIETEMDISYVSTQHSKGFKKSRGNFRGRGLSSRNNHKQFTSTRPNYNNTAQTKSARTFKTCNNCQARNISFAKFCQMCSRAITDNKDRQTKIKLSTAKQVKVNFNISRQTPVPPQTNLTKSVTIDQNTDNNFKNSNSRISNNNNNRFHNIPIEEVELNETSEAYTNNNNEMESEKVDEVNTAQTKSARTFKTCNNCQARNISFAKFCQMCSRAITDNNFKNSNSRLSNNNNNRFHNIPTEEVELDETSEAYTNNNNEMESEKVDEVEECAMLQNNDVSINKKRNKRHPHILVKIWNESQSLHTKNYKSLFDTGAALNYIDFNTYERLKHRYQLVLLNDNKLKHLTASGEKMEVQGYIVIPRLQVTDSFGKVLNLNNVSFTVANGLSYQVIVGASLMRQACRDKCGFIIFPATMELMLNVIPTDIQVSESIVSSINEENTPSYYKVTANNITSEEMSKEDFTISSTLPVADNNIINIGTESSPIFTSANRSHDFQKKLRYLIGKYASRFSTTYSPFKDNPEQIKMTGQIPTGQQRFIPLQPMLQGILQEKVHSMINEGVLSYSNKPANCCLMLVQKCNDVDQRKSGAWRVINDLVLVNRYVDDVAYHLPPINHLLNRCQSFQLYSKVDIPDAYHCIRIKADQDITAMVPGLARNVKFNVLPQGLKTATSIFSKKLDLYFLPEMTKELMKYLDDLLLGSKDESEMLVNIEKFLIICDKYNVRINSKKSVWGAETLEFLSYKIHKGCIGISKNHREAIKSINGSELSSDSLAGFLGYFSAYINDHNLLHLLRQETEWNSDKEMALKLIKDKILNAPMRTLVSFKDELKIYTDASDTGFSAALFQVSKDSPNSMEVVHLYSKNMSCDQSWMNKNIYERELYSLASAVTKFEYLIRGYHRVKIYTDNKAVSQSAKSRSFIIRNLFDRLKVEFPNVILEFIESTKNTVADILSRAKKVRVDDTDYIAKIPFNNIYASRTRKGKKLATAKQVKVNSNVSRQTTVPPQTNLTKPVTIDQNLKTSLANPPQIIKNLSNQNGKTQEILNKLTMFHVRGGHPSVERMYQLYRRLFPKDYASITVEKLRNHFKNCTCNTTQKDKTNFIPRYPSINRELFLDFKEIGTQRCALTDGRKQYRLSILEPLSGAIWSLPIKITTGPALVNLMTIVLMIHGKVHRIRTDNAPQFIHGVFEKFCKSNNIQLNSITSYNPTANLVERHHSSLNRLIKLSQPNYEEVQQDILDYVLTYNTIPSRHKFAPYEVLKGHLPLECLPIEFDADLEKPLTQNLPAQVIIEQMWQSRNEPNFLKTKSSSGRERFPTGSSVEWCIKLNTGIVKYVQGLVLSTNETSAYVKLNSNRKVWISKNNLRMINDPKLIINQSIT